MWIKVCGPMVGEGGVWRCDVERMEKEANWVREQRSRKWWRGKLANVADLRRVLSKVRQERLKSKSFLINNLMRRGSHFGDQSQTFSLQSSHTLRMCLVVPWIEMLDVDRNKSPAELLRTCVVTVTFASGPWNLFCLQNNPLSLNSFLLQVWKGWHVRKRNAWLRLSFCFLDLKSLVLIRLLCVFQFSGMEWCFVFVDAQTRKSYEFFAKKSLLFSCPDEKIGKKIRRFCLILDICLAHFLLTTIISSLAAVCWFWLSCCFPLLQTHPPLFSIWCATINNATWLELFRPHSQVLFASWYLRSEPRNKTHCYNMLLGITNTTFAWKSCQEPDVESRTVQRLGQRT